MSGLIRAMSYQFKKNLNAEKNQNFLIKTSIRIFLWKQSINKLGKKVFLEVRYTVIKYGEKLSRGTEWIIMNADWDLEDEL